MDRTERVWALSAVWAAAKEVYPYFHRLETDWDEAYRAYLPELLAEEDELGAWLRLAAFARLLDDGHSTVVLPKALMEREGSFPFRLRQIGSRTLLVGAEKEGLLLRELLGIDGVPMAELAARLDRWQYTSAGRPYVGRLERWMPLLLPGRDHMLQTDAGEVPFSYREEPCALLAAPEPESRLPWVPAGEDLRLFDGGILCARVDDMQQPERADAFQAALARLRPRAVLFDIRRNIGGMTLCGARYAAPFFSGSFGGCRKWTQARKAVDAASASQLAGMRRERAQRMIDEGILPREEFDEAQRYARHTRFEHYRDSWDPPRTVCLPELPVLLLVSRDTVSAAEDFAAFFRSGRRGLLMGEPSFGSTGSPYLFRLPDGGRGQVVSAGYELADGTPFIGCGIQPDIPCPPSVAELREGWDRPLDAAVETLRRMVDAS